MKDTFILKTKYGSIINRLSDKQAGVLFKMLFNYVENGANAGSTDERVDMAFEFIKMDLDAFSESYQKKVEANKENGKRGGNPNFVKGKSNPYYKGKDNPNITEDNQTLPKITEDNPNDNDNVNDNDISFLEKKKQKSASEKKIDSTENENSFVEDLDGKTSPQVAPAPPPDSEESKKTKKRFVPPTPEEVQDYCNERGNGISGTEFCDFYTSKGWKVGREPMKDWKAAVRTWEAKRKNNTQTNQTITIDENGNRITNTGNSNTNTSTPYVFGRQTAEDLRANLSGW